MLGRGRIPQVFSCARVFSRVTLHYVRTDVRMDKHIFQLKYYFRYGPSKQDYYAQISQMKVNDLHPIGFGQWQKSHLELLWCLRARFTSAFVFWFLKNTIFRCERLVSFDVGFKRHLSKFITCKNTPKSTTLFYESMAAQRVHLD